MRHLIKFGAVLAGAAAGATVGVLLAPGKGTKTRHKILDNLKAGIGAVNASKSTFSNMLLDFVSEKENNFDKKLRTITDRASNQKEEVIATLERKLSELKKDADHVKPNTKADIKDDIVYKAAYETKADI